ncbi:MAG: AI-2E family transporter [Anaerolineae bacterium]
MSKRWSDSTKRLVLTGVVIALALTFYRFRAIIAPTVLAIILAYILNPLVRFIRTRTGLSRGWAVSILYLILIVLLSLFPAIFVPILVQEMRQVNVDIQKIADGISQFFARPVVLFNYSFDTRSVYEEISGTLESIISSLVGHSLDILLGVAESFIWLFFILFISFYLLKDADKLRKWIGELVPPDYREEAHLLYKEIDGIWNAFLRAQILQCLLVGVLVGISMTLLGLRSALIIGLVGGIVEVIPRFGHTITAIVGVLFAYFEGSYYLPISNSWFAVIVIVFFVVFNEIDTAYILPSLVGRRLGLPPMVVLMGVIAGASLGGVLGILLAAPTLSTFRVLSSYVYRKLLDIEPAVVVKEPARPPPPPTPRERLMAIRADVSTVRSEIERKLKGESEPDEPEDSSD